MRQVTKPAGGWDADDLQRLLEHSTAGATLEDNNCCVLLVTPEKLTCNSTTGENFGTFAMSSIDFWMATLVYYAIAQLDCYLHLSAGFCRPALPVRLFGVSLQLPFFGRSGCHRTHPGGLPSQTMFLLVAHDANMCYYLYIFYGEDGRCPARLDQRTRPFDFLSFPFLFHLS